MEKFETITIEHTTAPSETYSIIIGKTSVTTAISGHVLVVAKDTGGNYAAYAHTITSCAGGINSQGGSGSSDGVFIVTFTDPEDGTTILNLDNSSGEDNVNWLVRYEILNISI